MVGGTGTRSDLGRLAELLADPGLDREGAALTFDVGEKRVKVRKGHAV